MSEPTESAGSSAVGPSWRIEIGHSRYCTTSPSFHLDSLERFQTPLLLEIPQLLGWHRMSKPNPKFIGASGYGHGLTAIGRDIDICGIGSHLNPVDEFSENINHHKFCSAELAHKSIGTVGDQQDFFCQWRIDQIITNLIRFGLGDSSSRSMTAR